MTPERLHESERIFHEALERADSERAAWVRSQCGGDHDLEREVLELLECAGASPHFLEGPADERVIAGECIDQYRLERRLGSGGMGQVWIAYDTRLDRFVALKFLPERLTEDDAANERLHREALAASALNHPGICTIYDIGQWRGRAYIAMELVQGESLQEHIKRGRLPAAEAADIGRQIAAALQCAHERGVIHRDIKPANVVMSRDGRVKVVDFGIARRSSVESAGGEARVMHGATPPEVATAPGTITGTPTYMSPEQARGESLDARSDVYSLGATLYELVTGSPPLQGYAASELLAAIQTTHPVRPSEMGCRLPKELEALILRMLRKEPEERPGSAAEVEAELVAILQVRGRRHNARYWIAASIAAAAVAGAAFDRVRDEPAAAMERLVPRQVTANPLADPVPRAAISPDGGRIAYVDLSGLHIANVSGAKLRTIMPPPGCCFR